MLDIIRGQIGKTSGHYRFTVATIDAEEDIPFMNASFLNGIRRELAEGLDAMQCNKKDILCRDFRTMVISGRGVAKDIHYKSNVSNRLSEKVYSACGAQDIEPAYELSHKKDAELMRTKYCIRYELGLCPKYHGSKDNSSLFLLNNGQKFVLNFDCKNCEMTLKEA
jgi:putative protease